MSVRVEKLDVDKMLRSRQALLEGHFKLSSGLHSDRYVQCARLFVRPADGEALGRALASLAPAKPDAVVSPALGGILAGYETARALGLPFVFTERQDAVMTLRRGFSLQRGLKALIVEDVVTTGKSTLEVAAVLRAAKAEPVAVASIIDRGCDPQALGFPALSLLKLPLNAWPEDQCPLCSAGKPVTKPGSRPC